MNVNHQYHKLLRHIIDDGSWRDDPNRSDVQRLQIPFADMTMDLRDGFPAITTKPLFWKGVVVELLWFLRGDTDVTYLRNHGVHIWDADAERWGNTDLGKIYGYQWRHWTNMLKSYTPIHPMMSRNFGIDQIGNLVNTLMTNPLSSSMIVTAWNPSEVSGAALPPCHWSFQVTCEPNGNTYYLDLQFNMRSSDVYLGLPFNIASYALLMHILAKIAGMQPRYLRYNGVNVHLYHNQLYSALAQLLRDPNMYPLPKFMFSSIFEQRGLTLEQVRELVDWKDFKLKGYKSYEPLPKVEMLTYDK